MPESIWITIVSILLSGVIGVIISIEYYRRYEKRKSKLDTLKRLVANRFALVPNSTAASRDSFFEALNEVVVVFHDSQPVLSALERMHSDLSRQDRLEDNVVSLFKSMFKHLDIEYELNESFFLRAFTPGPTFRQGGGGT